MRSFQEVNSELAEKEKAKVRAVFKTFDANNSLSELIYCSNSECNKIVIDCVGVDPYISKLGLMGAYAPLPLPPPRIKQMFLKRSSNLNDFLRLVSVRTQIWNSSYSE